MRVSEAVVISLPERADRLARLQASLPDLWPFTQLHLAPGVREDPPPWWLSSAGAWGCRQAHVRILESAWKRGIESTLVLEDDAVFAPHFARHYTDFAKRVPGHWSMVMLGGQHVADPQPVGESLVRCVATRRTHAYVIRLRAIPELLRRWNRARRHIDWALPDFQAGAWVYAPASWLIGQDAGHSDISGQDNPDVRFWDTGRPLARALANPARSSVRLSA